MSPAVSVIALVLPAWELKPASLHSTYQVLSDKETLPGWRMGTGKRFVDVALKNAAMLPGTSDIRISQGFQKLSLLGYKVCKPGEPQGCLAASLGARAVCCYPSSHKMGW